MTAKHLLQKHPDELHRALGTAMCQWQAIEGTLYTAFHNILGADQKYSAYLYYDTRSPERKVNMVDDLFRLYLGEKEYKKKAEPIFKTFYELTKERNNIAHFQAQMCVESETKTHKLFSLAMYFPYLNPAYERLEKFEYRTDDLFDLGNEFVKASHPLTELMNELFPNRTGPKKSRELTFRRPQRRSQRRGDLRSKKLPAQ